jgi:type II secretory pathway pseudopilin PulG
MKSCLKSAFSLVELLIVILITATIGSVIMACFMGGMRAYQRVDEFSRNEADIYIAFEMIERDLNNLVTVPDIPFDGDGTIMQFPALDVIPSGEDDDSGISRIRYVYTRYGGVMRSIEKQGDGGGGDGDSITGPDIEAFFSYSGSGGSSESGWSDSWTGESNFPSRVRIRFQVGGEDGDSLEQIIVIPIASSEKNKE